MMKTFLGHQGRYLFMYAWTVDTCLFYLKSELIFSEYGWFLEWNRGRQGKTLDTSLLWGVVFSGYVSSSLHYSLVHF